MLAKEAPGCVTPEHFKEGRGKNQENISIQGRGAYSFWFNIFRSILLELSNLTLNINPIGWGGEVYLPPTISIQYIKQSLSR